MQDLFCNECGLSSGIPHLVAEWLLGVEYQKRIEDRYDQMRKCYNYSYAEWQSAFTDELKPFGGYDNTTTVTIPIGKSKLRHDIKALNRGAIGVDLPTWFNMQENNKHIMIIAQDPLRSIKRYGECTDAVLSSPFGQHDSTHRQWPNGGKMMHLLLGELLDKGYGIYLTDANKLFIYDHKTTDKFSTNHLNSYTEIIRQEIDLVKPCTIVCLGRRAERMCIKMGLIGILPMPHLSGRARWAMLKKFKELMERDATVENIAEVYARKIMDRIENPV